MVSLLWTISAALRSYLRLNMPTNRVADWLRTPRGLKWSIPVALIATPAYLLATSFSATGVAREGPSYCNILVVLFFWNSVKFALIGLLAPGRLLTQRSAGRKSAQRAGSAAVSDLCRAARHPSPVARFARDA